MDRNEIARVMDLAAEIFADHGFSGVGMRELSSRCGVGAPTLYHYFGSKEHLFDAVCVEKYRKALSVAYQVLRPNQSVEEQLEALCHCVFDLLVNDRVLFLLLRRDLIDGSISGRELRSRHQYEGILELLRRTIALRQPDGDAERLSFTAAALIFGYCEFVHVSFNLGQVRDSQRIAAHRADLAAALRRLVLDPPAVPAA